MTAVVLSAYRDGLAALAAGHMRGSEAERKAQYLTAQLAGGLRDEYDEYDLARTLRQVLRQGQ